MSTSDSYFRFPLSALAYGSSPVVALEHIISYGVMSAGIGAGRDQELFDSILDKYDLDTLFHSNVPDYVEYQQLLVGADLTKTNITDWEQALHQYDLLDDHIREWPHPSALVTIKAQWVWNTLNTCLHEEGAATKEGEYDYLPWRSFRVLCAVLSVIGEKKFAWISSATLGHRVCGYTSKKTYPSDLGLTPEHLAPLSRWQLEATLQKLEIYKFFLAFRVSKAAGGRGGRTAYSIRHKDRQALFKDLAAHIAGKPQTHHNRELDRQMQEFKHLRDQLEAQPQIVFAADAGNPSNKRGNIPSILSKYGCKPHYTQL